MERETLQLENGLTIKVSYDEFADNPRDAFEYSSVIYANCDKYNFDRHHLRELAKKYNVNCVDDMVEKLNKNGYIALEIYGVLHSNIGLSTKGKIPNPWYGFDDIIFGIIAEEKSKIREEFGVKRISKNLRKNVEERMSNEIDELENYINGEVYAIEVTDKDGKEIDNYGGIIGREILERHIEYYKKIV